MLKYFPSLILIFITFFGVTVFGQVSTSTTDILKNKIAERNNQIKQLEEEIKQYNLEVDNAGKQAKTLQSTIKTLDLTKKKITTDISLTEKKINKTELTIEQLSNEIDVTENHIVTNKNALGQMVRNMQALDTTDVVVTMLSRKNISDLWDDVENMKSIQRLVTVKSDELRQLKTDMESKQTQTQTQKKQLVGLKTDLSGKKQAVESTTKEKATLLSQTKNKESAFKELVKTKEELKNQFEKDLFDFESQLNIEIDKSGYPRPRKGILSWPLDRVVITQEFGKTVAAQKLYTSGSHNGVDFGASIGTKVKSVLAGTVVGTGNTDIYPGCYSFGKWVMVRHDNGLSTIYGHLSVISATSGQRVDTGDLLGYSGNTGYTTGPHLHVSLYATQGVRIEQYVNSRGCKQATIPLADVKAYLDPLAYFPNL